MLRALSAFILAALTLAAPRAASATGDDPLAHVADPEGRHRPAGRWHTYEPGARQGPLDPTYSDVEKVASADSVVVTTAVGVLSFTGSDLEIAAPDGAMLLVVRYLGDRVWLLNPDARFLDRPRPMVTAGIFSTGEKRPVNDELLYAGLTGQWSFVNENEPRGVSSVPFDDIDISTAAGRVYIDHENNCWITGPRQERMPLCIQPGEANAPWRLINALAEE